MKMLTLYDVKKQKTGINFEQQYALIEILTSNQSKQKKRAITSIIKYKFYSLENYTYWKDFEVSNFSIVYKNHRANLASIRKSLLTQFPEYI